MPLDTVIPRAAGVRVGSAAATVLTARERVLELSQNSHDALLAPTDPGGLSLPLRAALATRVATINADGALIDHYRALLDAADETSQSIVSVADPTYMPPAEGDRWLTAVVAHADLLAIAPQDSNKATIEALRAAGVEDPDIVRLTQLVGFVVYQARLVAGLRLINEQ